MRGYPDTIPPQILELFLQVNGSLIFYEYKDNLYVFTGGFGGVLDVYYRPTLYTISNPALNFSASLKIGDECILVRNDTMLKGLYPLFYKYSQLLVENDISMYLASINTRIQQILTASDDRVKESAERYIDGVICGELGIIGNLELFGESEGIKNVGANQGKTGIITDLIELEQYLKASLYHEIGLNSNYNMKRESLNSAETELNEDVLMPLVDDMLVCRKTDLAEVNKKYGLSISVELNSVWKNNYDEKRGDVSRETFED